MAKNFTMDDGTILHEDNAILVVVKPQNMPSQADSSGDLDLLTLLKNYIKEKYNGRTMGYPDLQMQEFDGYDAYEEIGISMNIARSEAGNLYMSKGFPMHMFCADTEEDVNFCIEKGASLITANDPRPLLKVLGR